MYDYIVVGAGTAGCVLANRLSESPATRVLLLEAGPADTKMEIHVPAAFSKLFKSAVDWNYETVPQSELGGRRLYWPRGKMLGGTSSMNAQMHVRGNRADYDGWAALGNAGWSYDNVLPYFRKSERNERGPSPYRGTDGPLNVARLREPNPATRAFLEAAQQAGLARSDDINGARQDGVDYTQVTQKHGRRWSAADAYLRPAAHRRNLSIVTDAHATRILFERRHAVGVEYLVKGRRETARATREVIVAGGAVNSPQLLMLSGVGPAAHLRERGIEVVLNLPGVGQHLQDHLACGVIVFARQPVTLVAAESPANLLRYLLLRRGPLTSNVGEACGFVRSSAELEAPDLELIFAPVPYLEHGLVKPPGHGITVGAILLLPKSTGSITLRSANPLDAPVIDPRYLSDPDGRDFRLLVAGMKLAHRVMRSPALAAFAGEPMQPGRELRTDAEFEALVRERSETLYHPVGTCRMGSDAMAVVDAQLRVRGLEALRVVDASVMPEMIRGHTNSPTVMIAEKAADLIKGRPTPLEIPESMAATPPAAGTAS
jgi:choline dehydrogenase